MNKATNLDGNHTAVNTLELIALFTLATLIIVNTLHSIVYAVMFKPLLGNPHYYNKYLMKKAL